MSGNVDPGLNHEPVKTIGQNGFYLDRCLIGEAAITLFAELASTTAAVPGVELNSPKPSAFKRMAIQLFTSREAERQAHLIGNISKADAFIELRKNHPGLAKPIEDVPFVRYDRYNDRKTGAVYFGIFPDEEYMDRFDKERRDIINTLAGLAKGVSSPNDIRPKWSHGDARIAYVKPGVDPQVADNIEQIIRHFGRMATDLSAAFDIDKYLQKDAPETE